MGVYILMQLSIKPKDGAKRYVCDTTGITFCKREHPIQELFMPNDSSEYYKIGCSIREGLTSDEKKILQFEEDEFSASSQYIDVEVLMPFFQKISDIFIAIIEANKLPISTMDIVRFSSSIGQLLTVLQIVKEQKGEVEISFIYT